MRRNILLALMLCAHAIAGEAAGGEDRASNGGKAIPVKENAGAPKGNGGSVGTSSGESEGATEVTADTGEPGAGDEGVGRAPEDASDSEAEEKSINRTFGEAPEGVVETNRAAEKRKRAKEYFMRGELLFDGGDYAKAAEAFVLAYELVPHQAVLGNIALCYDKAGKWPDAVNYYRSYLTDPVESEENDGIRKRLKELERLVGEISVQCMVKSCKIRVNGIVKGPAPVTVVLLPGEHRIEAVVDGDVVESRLMTVGARESIEIVLKGKKEAGPPAVVRTQLDLVPEEPKLVASQMGPGFWISASVTFIGVSLVATFGALTLSTSKDFEATGDTDEQLASKGNNYELVTNIMIGVTCTAAVATLVTAVFDVRRIKKRNRNVAILPIPGLGVYGAF